MRRNIIFVFGLLSISITIAFAQESIQDQIKRNIPNPVPTSPNVASLGKYGDYKVSYFSGIPDISIPIFEVKSGGLTLPITLSYHASGVKPTDVASWVGLGWSLSAGGQLSRNVQGKPDDEYFYSNPLISSPSVCATYQYLRNSATGVTDTEPDIFSYSFLGRSGKFILPSNGLHTNAAPYLIPFAPIVVKRVNDIKYEITDEAGVLYRFGTNAAGESYTESTNATNGENPTLNAVTAWHLTDIVAPNSNDNIAFTYQNVGTSNTHDISYTFTVVDQCQTSNGGSCPNQEILPQLKNIDSSINQKGLSTIIFETGKLEFVMGGQRSDYNQNLKSLSEINVYSKVNGTYVLQKTISFIYSYFTNSTGINESLKLDEVHFKDKNATIIQRYKLSYFSNSFSWNRSSNAYLNARDLWGYYNGATQNSDLIVPRTVSISNSGISSFFSFGGAQNRKVNTQYVKEGVLSRIDFPTGGYTQFDYESNKYLDETGATPVPTLAGGLRVTQITSNDGGFSPTIVKTYKYGNAESGYGKPNFNFFQFNYSSEQSFYSACSAQSAIANFVARTYYSNSAFSLDAFDASPIRYNYVTEYFGDPSGNYNGRVEYVFDNGTSQGDVDLVVPSSGKFYRSSYSWKRGKLSFKTTYNKNNQIVSSSSIQYGLYKEANTFIGYGVTQRITGNNSTCSGATCVSEAGDLVNPNTFFFTSYYQNSGALMETVLTENTYELDGSGKFISSVVRKNYEPVKTQVVETTSSRGNQEEKVIVSIYPFQLLANNQSTGAAKAIYQMNLKNIVAVPIETYSYIQSSDGSNQLVTSAQLTTYKINEVNQSQVVPDGIAFFESQFPIPKSLYSTSAINSSNDGVEMSDKLRFRIKFLSYDNDGNLLTAKKINDQPASYTYGYNNSLPVTAIVRASNTEFMTQNFEDLQTSASVINSTVAHTGNQYFLGDYTLSFTVSSSRLYVVDYWYLDPVGRWQYMIKPYTGTEMILTEGTAIDDVRVYPKDAQISTFTYDPILGKTSETDTNGNIVFYEYDAFGRLKLTKDTNKNVVKAYDYQYKYQN